jgi:hypothetical protein
MEEEGGVIRLLKIIIIIVKQYQPHYSRGVVFFFLL